MTALRLLLSAFLLAGLPCAAPVAATPPDRILVFTRTAKFRHESIPVAVATLKRIAAAEGMVADHTEDGGTFTADRLARYRVVVFASTTGDVLDDAQEAALEGFVRNGGGFLGGHPAAPIMVGAPGPDVGVAGRAGVPVIGVEFGYPDVPIAELKPDRLIGHMRDLPAAVHSLGKLGSGT